MGRYMCPAPLAASESTYFTPLLSRNSDSRAKPRLMAISSAVRKPTPLISSTSR